MGGKWNFKELKSLYTYVHSSISHNGQKVEATQVSIDGRMDKGDVASTANGNYLALKRKEILTHATTWMKLEDTVLSLC